MHEMSTDFEIKVSILKFTMHKCLKLDTNLTHAVPKSSVLHSGIAIKQVELFFKVLFRS